MTIMKSIIVLVVCLILTVCSISARHVKVNTIAQGWAGKKADIFFIMDSSSSVWIRDFQDRMLVFVSEMVSEMDIGPNKTRVGIGSFSDKYREFLPVNNGRSKENLIEAIKDTPYVAGNGYISRAIEGVRLKGLSPAVTRKGVPLIAVLFTDGESRHHQLTIDNTTMAKKEGIYIYTIGIGRGVEKQELRNIASFPKDKFAFYVSNFYAFGNIKGVLMTSMSEVQFLQSDEGTCGKIEKADVVFVFDEYALGQEKSSTVKSFVKTLVKEFSMDSGNIRVGIISKTCHQGDITLGQYLTQADIIGAINNQKSPAVSSLLRKARLDGFRTYLGGRSEVRKRIVLIIEGEITDTRRLLDEARRAKFIDMEIFILPIDVKIGKGYLEAMASKESYITHVESIDYLERKSKAFLESFCRELN